MFTVRHLPDLFIIMTSDHYFSVRNQDEAERLVGQQNTMMKFDFQTYEKHLKGRKGLNILDIGCNTGRYAMMRLERFPGVIGNYVGIEYDKETVEVARSTYGSENITFNWLDITSDDFCDRVREIMEAQGIGSFDVIMMSLVLMHLKDKDAAARKIRSLMSENAVFILVDVDDGLNTMYPDPDGYMDMVNEIIDAIPITGTRYFGRMIPETFEKAGFSRVELEKACLTTVGMNRDERSEFFIILAHLGEMVSACNDGSLDHYAKWIDENLDSFKERFLDPGTTFSFGFLIFSLRI